ncbi:unnamed protein product [Rhizoctonia solani]|uniref:DUF4211 domain-containing protein n=1 Tax=Rhizoctonia solani TaxID=456999 RepID=A0A8H3GWP8_9AGAM|nr:unnamed protein product [Rhizoctonia solani]
MPPKPKPLPKKSSSPPIEVLDSDSDEQRPNVKRTTVPIKRGSNGKRQTTLVDFAASNKKKAPASVATVKVDMRTRDRTGPASSPIRRRTRLSHVKSPKSSPSKAYTSPIKARQDSDEDLEGATDRTLSTDADVGAVHFEKKGNGLGKKLSRVITSDEDEEPDTGKTGTSSNGDVEQPSEDESEDAVVAPRRVAKRKAVVISLSDSEEDDAAPRRRLARRQSIQEDLPDEQDEEDDPMDGLDDQVVLDSRLRSAPQRNDKRLKMRENLARLKLLDSDSDEQRPDVKRTTATTGAKRGSKGKWQTTLVDFAELSKKTRAASGSGPVKVDTRTGTQPGPTSSPVRRCTRLSPVKSSKRSPRKAHSSPIKVNPDSDEDESAPTDEAPSTDADVDAVQFENKGNGLGKKSSRVIASDEDGDESAAGKVGSSGGDVNQATEESEDEDVAPRRVAKRKAVLVLSDSEEENVAPRRRLTRRQSIQENPSDEEEEDLMDVVLDSRLRSAPERNNKRVEMRENLARLKRRKLGQDTPPVESSSEDEEEEEEEENVIKPRGRRVHKLIPGARPSQPTLQDWIDGSVDDDPHVVISRSASPARDDEEDSENDSWIEDDLDGGAPAAVLPEAYSMLGHQSLAHHFKVVMQLFVHLACLKAKERLEFRKDKRNDQYFGLALRALRRKMDGLRDSLVTSSKWTSGFKKALNTHPELEIHDLEFTVPGCGACRISSRLSRFKGALSGEDYDRDTFEWNLFELVSDEIEILRTAHRRKDPAPARGQRPAANDPDGIMNWLDGRGIVQQEWTRLEQLMDGARGLDFKKTDDDVE